MSERNDAAWLAKKERANTLNNTMHSTGAMESVIFDITHERESLSLQYNLMEKEILSQMFNRLSNEEKIELLSRFFNCSKALGKSFKQGIIDGIEYKISPDNNGEIAFGNPEHGTFVVINDQGMYSEICVDETNHYANLKNHDFSITLNNKIYVVDGEINEYTEIYDAYLREKTLKEFYDVMKPLCKEIASKNPEYSLSASGLGFFRTEISPEENIKIHTEITDEILPDYSTSNVTNKSIQELSPFKRDSASNMTYSDLVVLAEEYNKKCLEVYNIIQAALNSEYILDNKSR